MRVLGIDPGYAIVGWGVVDYAGNRFAPVDFGAAVSYTHLHCTASSRTMRMAARGATPCVIRSSTAGGVNRLSCSQLPPNKMCIRDSP